VLKPGTTFGKVGGDSSAQEAGANAGAWPVESMGIDNPVAAGGMRLIPYIGEAWRLCRLFAETDQFHG
jgi:hypothetical protein